MCIYMIGLWQDLADVRHDNKCNGLYEISSSEPLHCHLVYDNVLSDRGYQQVLMY